MTAGAGIVVASFLKIDYAFESHPVLSPVHRVSISVSPYLFSHSKPEGHLTPADAAKSVLAEEPEEVPAEELAREEAPAEKASVPEEQRQENAAPAEQEAQEMAPAGGMYWEE